MDISSLKDRRILITGATGLIGSAIVEKLLCHQNGEFPMEILALVRDEAKARRVFERFSTDSRLKFLAADICDLIPQDLNIDYIVHAACQTSSVMFSEKPVETVLSTVFGMRNMLEFARINNVSAFVYLSTLEVYGTPDTDEKISENHASNLLTMSPRSSYPEAKRMCENMGAAYSSEYGVPFKVVRLCQTFGEGVNYNDGRVFSEFARCIIEGRDIVLNTKGETKRSYLYIGDAVDAILTVLLKGGTCEVYNAANEETYCSIYEMACMLAENLGNGKTKVAINQSTDIKKFGYAPTLKINMDCSKLRQLGWNAEVGLLDAYKKMIDFMKQRRK